MNADTYDYSSRKKYFAPFLLTINELHNLISSNHLISIIKGLEIFIFECKIKGRSTKVFMLKKSYSIYENIL